VKRFEIDSMFAFLIVVVIAAFLAFVGLAIR